ncbi:MAG: HTH domain-containing protein [Gemmatimonadaceae bacterium]
MTAHEAAFQVLREAGTPLRSRVVAERVLKRGLVSSCFDSSNNREKHPRWCIQPTEAGIRVHEQGSAHWDSDAQNRRLAHVGVQRYSRRSS